MKFSSTLHLFHKYLQILFNKMHQDAPFENPKIKFFSAEAPRPDPSLHLEKFRLHPPGALPKPNTEFGAWTQTWGMAPK